MTRKNFSLSDLVPEHDTFTDNDPNQTVHKVRGAKEFSSMETASWARLQRKMERAQRTFLQVQRLVDQEESLSDEERPDSTVEDLADKKIEAAMRELQQAVSDCMQLIIPTLPPERLKAIEFVQKEQFITWWTEQQPKPPKDADPNSNGDTSTRPASSPDSSASTISTLSAS